MNMHRTCDGMKRRDMLKVGTLTVGGLTAYVILKRQIKIQQEAVQVTA